ncbi:MAG: hypothetical protein AB7U85_05325 [Alphaproteobacteria bacterium]
MNDTYQEISTVYRREKGVNLIEISLSTMAELFNPIDPSPLNKKDLEIDVEDYIVTGIKDFPLKSAVNVIIYLPDDEIEENTSSQINGALNNFFAYRAWSTRNSLRTMFKDARISLVFGILTLSTAISCKTILMKFSSEAWAQAISESLVVAGWVAMWHPIQKFLYEWWPLRKNLRVYEKLTKVKVECRPHSSSPNSIF